jgi:predicted PhzF superfamily epimerase YddE/YHI9
MNFPARLSQQVPTPSALVDAIGVRPLEVMTDRFNYLVLLESADQVRHLEPRQTAVANLDLDGVIVTAAGDQGYDFVSRYFAPAKGIPEDPVTGGAHCALAPYWGKRLNKLTFRAYQASRRGGEVLCRLLGDRVELEGGCVFYSEGSAEI